MVPMRDLTDRALKALKPAKPGKRYYAWDAQITGFGVRVNDGSPPDISFVLVTRYPGATQPAPRKIADYDTCRKARDKVLSEIVGK